MFHTIAFTTDLWVDLARSPSHPLERTLIRRRARQRAQLRPHVVETPGGPIEVADLYFEDGTTARDVPYGSFRFVDERTT